MKKMHKLKKELAELLDLKIKVFERNQTSGLESSRTVRGPLERASRGQEPEKFWLLDQSQLSELS